PLGQLVAPRAHAQGPGAADGGRRPRGARAMRGFLALEDGSVFRGESVVTDPSYAEQIVVFSAPMVGNYGVEAGRCESPRPHARAVVMREARGPAWTDWLHQHGLV